MTTFTIDPTIHVRDARWKTLLRPYCKTVQSVCTATLADTKLATFLCKWEMAIMLADDAFIRELNKDYRGKNKPTNVLSFPSETALEANLKTLVQENEFYLGDIILALETIEAEAVEQGKTVKHHAMHLICHGILHLLGHDHEIAEEAAIMEAKEIKILEKLKVKNPYL